MSEKVKFSSPSSNWASHPAYARYWQHYHQAMAWMRGHQLAYRKALEAYYSAFWYSTTEDTEQTSTDGDQDLAQHSGCLVGSRTTQHRYSQSRRGATCQPQRNAQLEEPMSVSSEWSSSSDSEGVECDVSNMEITQELRDYFAQTERHREERKRQQLLDEKRLEDYVNADHDLYYSCPQRSVEPPNEKVWERRMADMKRLYGDSAAKIQAMEAAMQLDFDKHCDKKRPKYWPVIPLKF